MASCSHALFSWTYVSKIVFFFFLFSSSLCRLRRHSAEVTDISHRMRSLGDGKELLTSSSRKHTRSLLHVSIRTKFTSHKACLHPQVMQYPCPPCSPFASEDKHSPQSRSCRCGPHPLWFSGTPDCQSGWCWCSSGASVSIATLLQRPAGT